MKSKLGIASLLLIIATIFLKASGLLRDMTVAYFFGTGFEAGAYFVAFNIPNTIILFLNTGMKNALVPSYISALEKDRGAFHLSQVMKGTLVVSILISIAGASLAPFYMPLLYSDFSEEALRIAVITTIIFFSCMTAVGMNAVLEAYFDAVNRFAISVTSQTIVILSSIGFTFLFADQMGVYAIAVGYAVGTVISLLLKLLFFVKKGTFGLRVKLDKDEVKSFFLIFFPVAITVMVGQLNLMVDYVFAGQFEERVVAFINNAKNLVHFPQALIGVTISTIIFPLISRARSQNDHQLFRRGIQQGFSVMGLVLFPAVAGMMWLMPTIIELVFERGAFTAESTAATVTVAYFYAGSVLFFSMQTVLNKGFYALQKGNLILRIGLISVVLNAVLNYVFTTVTGSYNGIPLASSVMAFLYFAVSLIVFSRLINENLLKGLLPDFLKILTAVGLMILTLAGLKPLIADFAPFIYLIISAIAGGAVYGVVILLWKVSSVQLLLKRFKRGS